MARLEDTSICINCDEVFPSKNNIQCPACGSVSTQFLSLWIPPLSAVWGEDRLYQRVEPEATDPVGGEEKWVTV